jgi:[acyl-carrier-protein] S-malonyltransferase
MKAYIFPGQGSQFSGMGKDLFENNKSAQSLFEIANHIIGFPISTIMFEGSEEDLRQTNVTQPAIFIHSVIMAMSMGDTIKPDFVAGHSLGEFSALVANKTLSFEDGLRLVIARANAMKEACDITPGTMAAVLGLEDKVVEDICASIDDIVVAANYNCPGQLVISGSLTGVQEACKRLTDAGSRRAMILNVGGAFHSPLMEPAREKLATAIELTQFNIPICPIYQNATAKAYNQPEEIKRNLIAQLTAPVRWTQTIENMIVAGANEFIEVGPGKVLQGLVKKINKEAIVQSASIGIES